MPTTDETVIIPVKDTAEEACCDCDCGPICPPDCC